MQQYFSVAEVLNALQQVMWKRQQQQQQSYHGGGFYDPVKVVGSGKDYKRGGGVGYRQGQGHKGEFVVKDGHNATAEFKIPPKVANRSGNIVGIEVNKSDDKDVKLSKFSYGTKPQIDNTEAKEVDGNANSKGLLMHIQRTIHLHCIHHTRSQMFWLLQKLLLALRY